MIYSQGPGVCVGVLIPGMPGAGPVGSSDCDVVRW